MRPQSLSAFGQALTASYHKPKLFAQTQQRLIENASHYSQFSYAKQYMRSNSPELNLGVAIVPFDFATPSPDDVVKEKQKAAFTRGDGNFMFKTGKLLKFALTAAAACP